MSTPYQAPLRDISFCYRELFEYADIKSLPGYGEFESDILDAVMNEYAKFCENEALPLNQSGDQEGCTWEKGEVKTPKGLKALYQKYVEGGWPSIASSQDYGGQGLPESFAFMIQELLCSTNMAFGLYPGLTEGAYTALTYHGTDELKQTYLPNLVKGTWTGTMNLTEPHCGTDLGLLSTKADPSDDGSYAVTGTKIFISCGEHDLAENIIHLVLARTPTAPKGVKGISMFLVPKFLVKEDGSLGERNTLSCASIEHKMGIHASSTCVMAFEKAKGWLIGEENEGLKNMFTMMNTARLFVGLQGLGVAEIAYQTALAYARERLQGRALTGAQYPDQPADPLMVHPDIRRMLLTMRAYNEGCRMLGAWVAREVDRAHKLPNETERQKADDFVQLMTPVVKSFFTDRALDVTSLAMQVHGGYGYIKEYGVEQFLRDTRITQIYEGTNGIQALDLVGRKMSYAVGRYLRSFFHPVQDFITEHKDNKDWEAFILPLSKAFGRLQRACAHVAQKGLSNPNEAAAVASDLLDLFGFVALGYLWTRAAMISHEKKGQLEDPFYEGKYQTALFYMKKILPKSSSLFATIMEGASPLMTIQDEQFGPFDFTGEQNADRACA